jgi:DNA-binding phage protein
MAFNLKKLQEIAKPESAEELREAKYREDNREWLKKSALIALSLEGVMRAKGISCKELAKLMGVSPAQITKILSGKENLGLKTICKIEKVLQYDLMKVPIARHPHFIEIEPQPTIQVTILPYTQMGGIANNRLCDGGYSSISVKKSARMKIAIS